MDFIINIMLIREPIVNKSCLYADFNKIELTVHKGSFMYNQLWDY